MSDPPIRYSPDDESFNRRRAQVNDADQRNVVFAQKSMTPERLQALKDFLAHAKGDEIAAIRQLYGDSPDVLRMIGFEVIEG